MSETPRTKVVVVLRAGLPINLSTNAAAVLAATLGSRLSLSLGPDATDASGTWFPGIVTTPIPILVADATGLADLFGKANNDGSLEVAPMTEVARRARTYESFLEAIAETCRAEEDLVALCIAGPHNRVTRLTKRLALLTGDN